jgi:hypothetical protein
MCNGWNKAKISESEIKDFELFRTLADSLSSFGE